MMILIRLRYALCIVALFVSAFVINAQSVLRGSVFDADTRDPLAGAFVYVYNGNKVVKYGICDGNGDFRIEIGQNASADKLVVNFIGFKSASVPLDGRSDELKIMMKP